MSYKVYKSQNYFVVHDTATSVDVIRQVRDLVRWEKKGTLYSFYYNTPNLTTSGNAIIRLGSVYEFSDLVDSTGTAWVSQSALDLYLEKWTGHICYETNVDNLITVNGASDFTINAGDALDIILTDGTSSVTPVSVTPNAGLNKVDIVLPTSATPTSASAKVMQTGQTSTYSTDEIGYATKGRLVDFFTVNFITPFGNSNRFTSTNFSAQTTYADEIVLDWSTFDEPTQTVLGYDRRLVHSGATYDFTHSAGITLAKNHSRGTYTSGWRMWNRNEFNNIVNLEYPNGFAPPFDNASGGQLDTQNMWLFNTLKASTSNAWFTVYYGNIDYGAKSGNRRVVAVRDFTVSGTTIL